MIAIRIEEALSIHNANITPLVREAIPEMERIFPELDGSTIRVKICLFERACLADYDYHRRMIRFHAAKVSGLGRKSFPAIFAHELGHDLQSYGHHIPYGERACDLFMLARLPEHLYPDSGAFYLSVSELALRLCPGVVKAHAMKAIEKRSQGLRNYIDWFEKTLPDATKEVLIWEGLAGIGPILPPMPQAGAPITLSNHEVSCRRHRGLPSPTCYDCSAIKMMLDRFPEGAGLP